MEVKEKLNNFKSNFEENNTTNDSEDIIEVSNKLNNIITFKNENTFYDDRSSLQVNFQKFLQMRKVRINCIFMKKLGFTKIKNK